MKSQDVTRDAVVSTRVDTVNIVETGLQSNPVYFTEGEMLPWKGRWFKVKLLELDGEKIIGLVMQKATDSRLKREARKERWLKQHQAAVSARSAGLHLQKESLLGLR